MTHESPEYVQAGNDLVQAEWDLEGAVLANDGTIDALEDIECAQAAYDRATVRFNSVKGKV